MNVVISKYLINKAILRIVVGLIALVAASGTIYAQRSGGDADPVEEVPPASDSTSEPFEWTIIGGLTIDNIHTSGPHTFSQSSDSNSICVRTGYAGEATHAGFSFGIGYGPFTLRCRYTDLSASLDTIQYEFRTLGLELGYVYRPFKHTPVLDGFGIVGTLTLDTRLGDFKEGFGNSRTSVTEAPRIVPSVGIGLDYQFRVAGIAIGPEYQFRKSWTNLAGGDDIFEWFHSIGVKVQSVFGSPEAPPKPAVSYTSMLLLTNVSQECDFYIIPDQLYTSNATEVEALIQSCFNTTLSSRSRWSKVQGGFGSATVTRSDGPYRIIAVTRGTDSKHCYRYSLPEAIQFNGSSSQWKFDLKVKRCNCQ